MRGRALPVRRADRGALRGRGLVDRRSPRRGALVLVFLTLVAYLPAQRGGFVWDDDVYVTNERSLRSVEGLRSIWTDPRVVRQYYPVTMTTFWIEYRIAGPTPALYHFDNVLLHGASAAVLWTLLSRLAVPGGWAAAAIFALHPVHVETVAWISERKNVLSGLLYLCSAFIFLCWIERAEPEAPGPGQRHRRLSGMRRYALGALLFLGAVLSKSVTVTLPAALAVVLWWRKGHIERRVLAALAPLALVGVLFGLLTVRHETDLVGAQGAEWALSGTQRVAVAARALLFYLSKLLWPAGLSFVYRK